MSQHFIGTCQTGCICYILTWKNTSVCQHRLLALFHVMLCRSSTRWNGFKLWRYAKIEVFSDFGIVLLALHWRCEESFPANFFLLWEWSAISFTSASWNANDFKSRRLKSIKASLHCFRMFTQFILMRFIKHSLKSAKAWWPVLNVFHTFRQRTSWYTILSKCLFFDSSPRATLSKNTCHQHMQQQWQSLSVKREQLDIINVLMTNVSLLPHLWDKSGRNGC